MLTSKQKESFVFRSLQHKHKYFDSAPDFFHRNPYGNRAVNLGQSKENADGVDAFWAYGARCGNDRECMH